jgi:hypothetical protein
MISGGLESSRRSSSGSLAKFAPHRFVIGYGHALDRLVAAGLVFQQGVSPQANFRQQRTKLPPFVFLTCRRSGDETVEIFFGASGIRSPL